ncbi:MAG: restriction endonuclease [Clostridia bacterium]|nr:restriction endonuclease [Clostridia bacterium]
MARKKQEVKEGAPSTRAEKKEAAKALIREILAVKPLKHNELIDEVSKLYATRFAGEETENINDVKGRVGSVLDIMKKDGDVAYEEGMYALKARAVSIPEPEKQPEKKTRTRKKTEEKAEVKQEEETPAEKKPRAKKAKTEEVKVAEAVAKTEAVAEEKPKKPRAAKKKAEPLPAAPIQPIAPVAPVTPEVAPEPIPKEQAAPKKRGRKPKAKAEEPVNTETVKEPVAPVTPEVTPEPKAEEKPEIESEAKEARQLVVKEKAEVANKGIVMDMSFLFGDKKPMQKPVEEKKPETKAEQKTEPKTDKKPEQKPVQKQAKAEEKPAAAVRKNVRTITRGTVKKPVQKPLSADEKLKEAFLRRIRTLGGDYFEYYSVYLLERYSMKNGRRLEGLKISGGDHDGGIDGEIELTDKLGFRETIYIQSKNWNPEKGDERLWVVGETLLQQFIGACACRQAKDGKQHCRGIFITTSRFTPEAKRILNDLSDKIVGYDGDDVYEAAKECGFGLVLKNGEWALDEKLLSGSKAFFSLV